MRKDNTLLLSRFCLVLLCAGLLACSSARACIGQNGDNDYYFWKQLAQRAATEAWQNMGLKPSADDAIVLTNAGYAMVNGSGTMACLDGLQAATGAKPGKGTLLDVHSSVDSNLYFFFYDKDSGKSAYLELDPDVATGLLNQIPYLNKKKIRLNLYSIPEETLFSHIGGGTFKADTMFVQGQAQDANQIWVNSEFNGREFSIMGITLAILNGAPADALRSIQFHDHYCPGVTSGIMLARYVLKEYPSTNYFYFSMPPWCKDDAMQIMLNKTPGKKGYAVTYLTDADFARMKNKFANIAGIMFRFNDKKNAWQGIALGFDFDAAQAASVGDYAPEYSWQQKLKYDVEMLKFMDTPEMFSSTLKKFLLPEGAVPSDYARPGVDQIVEFGLAK